MPPGAPSENKVKESENGQSAAPVEGGGFHLSGGGLATGATAQSEAVYGAGDFEPFALGLMHASPFPFSTHS